MSKFRSIDHHPKPHSHPEHPDPVKRPIALKRLKIVLMIAASLIGIEIVGSWVSGSLALLADAFHVLGDMAGLIVTLIAGWFAVRPQSPQRSYGYYRLEILAALLNSFLLIALAFVIFRKAYDRFQHPQEIWAQTMLGVAVFGLIINVIMLAILRPAHEYNLNLRGAYLHVLGDSISSVAVIAGAYIIYLTHLTWIDAVASAVVATMLLILAIRLMLDSIHVLLEGTPKHMNPQEIELSIRKAFPEIVNVHDFHVWEITSHLFAMTAHIEAKIHDLKESRRLIDTMNEFVQKKYGIGHTTFQVEAKAPH